MHLPKSYVDAHLPRIEPIDEDLFVIDGRAFGIVFEMTGIDDAFISSSALETRFESIRRALASVLCMDSKTIVQLICHGRRVKGFESKTDNPFGKLQEEERTGLHALGLGSRRFFLTVTVPIQTKTTGAFSWLFDQNKALAGSEADFNSQQQNATQVFDELKRALVLESVDHGQWLALVHRMLYTEHESATTINSEITMGSGSTLSLANTDALSICVATELPASLPLGQLSVLTDSIGGLDFDLVWTFTAAKTELATDDLAKLLWWQRGPAHQKKASAMSDLQGDLSVLKPYGNVSLVCILKEQSATASLSKIALETTGILFAKERLIAPQLIASSLPLCANTSILNLPKRHHTVRLESGLLFAPLYGKGNTTNVGLSLVSRACGEMKIDLLSGASAQMACILGSSGCGKSVFTHLVIIDFLRRYPNGFVAIIDRKTSYEKLMDLAGGSLFWFSKEALLRDPLNPLALVPTDASELDMLAVLIETALLVYNKQAVFSALHTELLSEALKLAYNEQAVLNDESVQHNLVWADVLCALARAAAEKKKAGIEKVDEALGDLSAWSLPFGETGALSFLFSARSNRNVTDSPFVLFDLDGIADPRLLLIACQLAAMLIDRKIKTLGPEVKKLIIFEELGMLGHDDDRTKALTNRFVAQIVKTARKQNAIAIGISNEVDDFLTGAGKTFWQGSPTKVFLPLNERAQCRLFETLDPEASFKQGIKSLKLDKTAGHTGVLIDQDGRKQLGILPLSPFMAALTSTEPSDLAFYRTKREMIGEAAALDALSERITN